MLRKLRLRQNKMVFLSKKRICIIPVRRVYDIVPANNAQLVFEFFQGNIRKVVPKYVTLLCFFYINNCFFYMNIIVCHKEHWKIIRNIRFYNSCFKFGFGNRVGEDMIYSCFSVLSNAYQFVYNWHHAMAKHNINKILYFFILFQIKQVHTEIDSRYLLLSNAIC